MHHLASASASSPGIPEPVAFGIAVLLLGLYQVKRAGMPVIHFFTPFILGALSAGLWPVLGGKIASWGASAPRDTLYFVLIALLVIVIFITEKAARAG